MLLIPCPWCGRRDEIEFQCGGQSHLSRPEPYAEVGDEQWGAYLFLRDNPKGWFRERWVHVHGCRQWFNIVRDTVTHQILVSYRMGETAPELPPRSPL